MTLRLDRLDANVPIVGANGKPSVQFQLLWQRTVEAITTAFNQIDANVDQIQQVLGLTDALQTAVDNANAAASAATAAAAAAATAAGTAQAGNVANSDAQALAGSYVEGLTITAADAGFDAGISISAHSRVYADAAQTTVAVNAGGFTGLTYNTTYYIYYDQPSRAGGAVTYQFAADPRDVAQVGDRHSVGRVTTPAIAAAPTTGGGVLPLGANFG